MYSVKGCVLLLLLLVGLPLFESAPRDEDRAPVSVMAVGHVPVVRQLKVPKALRDGLRKKDKKGKKTRKATEKKEKHKKSKPTEEAEDLAIEVAGPDILAFDVAGPDTSIPTSMPSALPSSNDACPMQHVCDFYIAFAHSDNAPDDAITDADVAQLRRNTESFFKTALRQSLQDMYPAVFLNDVVLMDYDHGENSIHDERRFSSTLLIRSAFFDMEGEPRPSHEELFRLVQDSISVEYLLHYVRTIPGFSSVNEVVLKSVPNPMADPSSGVTDVSCPERHVCDFYIAFANTLKAGIVVTDDHVAELSKNTGDFFESALSGVGDFTLNDVVLVDFYHTFESSLLKGNLDSVLVVRSAFFDVQGDRVPTNAELYELIKSSINVEYILKYIRTIPPFAHVDEVFLRSVDW